MFNLENFLINVNFGLLIFTMILYFLDSASFLPSKIRNVPNYSLLVSTFLQTLFLGLRWFSANYFPLSNLYESLLFLSWVLSCLLVFFNRRAYILAPLGVLLSGREKSEQILSFNQTNGPFIGRNNELRKTTFTKEKQTPLIPLSLFKTQVVSTPIPQAFAGDLNAGYSVGNEREEGNHSLKTAEKKNDPTFTKNQGQPSFKDSITKGNFETLNAFLGSILTPFILLINTFATFSLPLELKLTTSLVPALKSNWLMMHVTFMILSYGALLFGCLLAMAFLLVSFLIPNNQTYNLDQESLALDKTEIMGVTQTQNSSFESLSSKQTSQSYSELLENFDNLSYRIIGFGFPLLTIGILSGAVWANQTWGSYWSWDPKETWALITWLVFAIYLHTRISHGWTGRQSALIASFGFLIIWICYLGVNLLGKGLHSYGFF